MKEKQKKKPFLKRLVSTAAAVAMGLSSLVSTIPASAASNKYISYDWDFSKNPNQSVTVRGTKNSLVGSEAVLTKGQNLVTRFHLVDGNGDRLIDRDVFCIEPGAHLGSTFVPTDPYESWDYTDDNDTDLRGYLKKIKQAERENKFYLRYFGMAQYYGYPGHSKSGNDYVATQLLIWEMAMGYRSVERGGGFKTTKNFTSLYSYPSGCTWCSASGVKTAYNNIVSRIQKHYDRPDALAGRSDAAKKDPYLMKYNPSEKRYQTTIKMPTAWIQKNAW